jgi:DNA primase
MAQPGDFAYSVKQQADIVRIVGDYVTLKKTGAQNFGGLCPFHKEKTPSFSVHATKQFFHCFGCGASGDIFSFVQKIENITFPEAVRAVAQKVGIELPKQQFSGPAEAAEAKLRGQLLDMHERACAFFEEQLRKPEAAKAREYLAGRGLDEKAIAHFRIGFAPESGFLLRDRMKSQFDEEQMRASGLFSWKEKENARSLDSRQNQPLARDDESQRPRSARDDEKNKTALYSKFRNRVTFPICNEQGKIIAFTGRTLATDEKAGPKYLNSPETPIYSKSRVLFNLDKAKEAIRQLGYSILVEGQMDCISVYNAGFHNVIASSGTAFTEAQVRLLGRFSKNIVVNFDPDNAGAAAAERSLALLVEEDFTIKVLTLEAGFDPDLFVRRRGAEGYASELKNSSRPYFDYLIERARAQFATKSPAGKVQAVNFLLPHIQRVPSRIVRDELAQNIAQKLSIDSAVLKQELRHIATTRTGAVKASPEIAITGAERVLLKVLSEPADSELREQAAQALGAENLHSGLGSEALLQALMDRASETEPLSLAETDVERSALAAALMDESEELTAKLVEQTLRALREQRLERQMRSLKAEIAEAERRSDAAQLSRLMQQKVEIDRALAGR